MRNIEKLRYLFISRTLRGGGAERFVSTFTSYLAECGYDVHLLLYETTNDDYALNEKVKKHILPFEPITIKRKISRIWDMKKAISDISPDIIIPFIDTVVFCSFIANLFTKSIFVYTVRVSPWHERLKSSSFSNLIRKIIAYKADVIMLQTKEQGDFFPKSYSYKEYVVPNPIPEKYKLIKKSNYKSEYDTIVMTGRLEKQKNIPLLINAFSEIIRNTHTKVNLYIYGEGVEKDNLQVLIDSLEIREHCYLMGRSSNVDQVLKNADLFVITSDYEGMPNSLMEAMAIGVPCISSNCKTGPKDLIDDNKTGLLFDVGDDTMLIQKLEWAINHTSEMNQIGQYARDIIQSKFNIEKSKKCFDAMVGQINTFINTNYR